MLSVQQGSLYPALHRLEQQGWIDAEWKDTDLGRSAKFYALTREGRSIVRRVLKEDDEPAAVATGTVAVTEDGYELLTDYPDGLDSLVIPANG